MVSSVLRLLRAAGGVLSFDYDGSAAALSDRLRAFRIAPSLGGAHSLVTWPNAVTHAGLSAEEQAAAGLGSGLVRLALGLEDAESLWTDLERALDYSGTMD